MGGSARKSTAASDGELVVRRMVLILLGRIVAR